MKIKRVYYIECITCKNHIYEIRNGDIHSFNMNEHCKIKKKQKKRRKMCGGYIKK